MKLPGNAIGISDILDWRECPARFVRKMERWSEEGEPPEHTNENNAYGSAIHAASHYVETEACSNEEAIQRIWGQYGKWLDVDQLKMLHEDLDLFRTRTPLGVRLVAAESDMRVPLFVQDGVQYYFRFRLDQLYQRLDAPGVFIHRDLKSSAWRRTDKEVHEDPQMWAYNFGIHEVYPECTSLLQLYDQLRFGVVPTTKNPQQRALMKEWLIANVKAILADETFKPKINDWCPWCPLVLTCSETARATTFWRARLGVLAPMTTVGRAARLELDDSVVEVEELIRDLLPAAMKVSRHLELFVKTLKGLIAEMPAEQREALGWRMVSRNATSLDPDALRALYEAGVPVFDLATLTKTAMEQLYGKPKKGEPVPPEMELFQRLSVTSVGASFPIPIGEAE